ncbi:hypothetical protein GALMADRAFT_1052344 [Galerina marginata CBS 339.88]|uniref:Uncharacterized protein n=1 Tax=Galerina marginata (strain CBS 339.88) TaxID=685588 RepID=A0A067SDR8_GALM3|nr:hypothetical protein GALMADRAFT_1052344 [Galerina marginata CBS 339.88]
MSILPFDFHDTASPHKPRLLFPLTLPSALCCFLLQTLFRSLSTDSITTSGFAVASSNTQWHRLSEKFSAMLIDFAPLE